MTINQRLVVRPTREVGNNNEDDPMKSLKGISSFVAVASSGSFTQAAKLQGTSAVAVSKNVATLERQLGVRLFQRTTRKINLTAEGQSFFKQCLGPLRELEAAQAQVEQSSKALTGLVRVTSASPFGAGFLIPLIPDFHTLNPKVTIELHLDDAVSDLVAQSYDLGVRIGELKDSTRIVRPLAPLPFVCCASPEYLRQRGTPKTFEDLLEHNCLRLRRAGRDEPFPWLLSGLDSKTDALLQGNFLVNDFSALVMAGVQGQGVLCAPLPLVMPMFRSGQLQPLLATHIDPKIGVYVHYPNRKNLPARTRAFVDFVIDRLGRERDLQTPHRDLVAPFVVA
jgi:DNA-binding transcriptional LysR family regulator